MNPRIDRDELVDDTLVTFVPMPAVEALTGRMDTSDARPYSTVKKGFTAFATGDVLFAKITPCMENGKMAIAPRLPHGVGFGSTEFHVMRPLDDLDERYLYYFVSSSAFRHEAQHNMTGAVGQKRVPRPWLENQRIPLPPLPEQRRIVEKIETLFARLDKAEEAVRQVQALLKRYRQSVLKAAVTGDLTADWREANRDRLEHGRDLLARILRARRETWEGRGRYKEPVVPDTAGLPDLPEGWVWASVGMLGEVITGGTPPTTNREKFYGGDIPFLKPTDLDQGASINSAREFLSEAGANVARTIGKDAVLVTCIGATTGKTGISRFERAAFNQQINAIAPVVGVALGDFVYWAIVESGFQAQIWENAAATTLPIINKSKFSRLTLPLPALEEQAVIVDEVSQRFSEADVLEAWCRTELARSTALHQSILKQAFSGRLVPQDPTDEPASALLARIRAAVPARKKRKTAA
jgi:type I restriction enzyme S subunit